MRVLFAVISLFIMTSCTVVNGKISKDSDQGQWEEANKLFLRDQYWVGADDAYSIKLNGDKVFWLFGDTLISKEKGNKDRNPDDTYFIHNTIGIQDGLNPAEAKIKYYWKHNSDGTPKSFFKSSLVKEQNWLWPGDAAVIDNDKLIIFFMDIKPVDYGFGFDIDGWQVVLIKNYRSNPEDWKMQWLQPSDYQKFKIMIGSGGVLTDGKYLYAYGDESANFDHRIYLARWPLAIFNSDNPALSNPEWWCGGDKGWLYESAMDKESIKPFMLWDKGQTEFTVSKFPKSDFYIMVQSIWESTNPGNADLVCRISNSLTGPWSKQYVLYKKLYRVDKIPEDLNVYAGKMHPELTDGNLNDLIFTYATNTQSGNTLWDWDNVYYPRFIRLSRQEVERIINEN